MLAVTPATRFLIAEGPRIRVEVSLDQRLGGYLTEHPWPMTTDRHGNRIDLSVIGPAESNAVDKLYTTRVAEGWAAMYDPDTEDFFAMTFRPEDIPFVGICAIRGRWPTASDSTLIGLIEPCNGWPDRLDVAIAQGECVTIPSHGQIGWRLTLGIGRGRAVLAKRKGSDWH
jgi:hypothetical protein